MVNQLSRAYNPYPYGDRGVYTNPYVLDNETLPNGGGTYNPSGDSAITPPRQTMAEANDPATFRGSIWQVPENQQRIAEKLRAETAQKNSLYEKYRDPKTGKIMSPEEYAIYLGNRIPKGKGGIPQYAGDAMTNPNQSAAELTNTARNMNNARNDIATGTTDPYKVGNKSGIAYSPQELKAIENAYAGIYDPALNDVFSRLQEKKDEDAQEAKREDKIFATDEAIRQWKATTGTKSTGGSSNSGGNDYFTDTQLNKGAIASRMGVDAFRALQSADVKNYFINPPKTLNTMEQEVPFYEKIEEDYESVTAGDMSAEEMAETVRNTNELSPEVKYYIIANIPVVKEVETIGFLNRLGDWKDNLAEWRDYLNL